MSLQFERVPPSSLSSFPPPPPIVFLLSSSTSHPYRVAIVTSLIGDRFPGHRGIDLGSLLHFGCPLVRRVLRRGAPFAFLSLLFLGFFLYFTFRFFIIIIVNIYD